MYIHNFYYSSWHGFFLPNVKGLEKDATHAAWHGFGSKLPPPPESWPSAALLVSRFAARRHAQLLAPEGLVSGVSEETIQALLDS